MSPQKLLVIVVVYNGMPWLERCLGSVSGTRSELLSAVDLFVVDNGSTDGSADFVAARFPEAMLVRSGQNLGFGRANNLGLQHAIENGYDAILRDKYTDVHVTGPTTVVEALKRGDISVYVDLTGLGPGAYNLPVRIESIPGIENDMISLEITTVSVTIG